MPAPFKMLVKPNALAPGSSPCESWHATRQSMNFLDTVTLHLGFRCSCRLWQKLPSPALPWRWRCLLLQIQGVGCRVTTSHLALGGSL